MEIDDPGARDNGRLVRCFDRIPDNIMMGKLLEEVGKEKRQNSPDELGCLNTLTSNRYCE